MSWNQVLTNFAKLVNPQSELTSSVYYSHSNDNLIIQDGYNKSRYHLLILPRLMNRIETEQDLHSLNSLIKSGKALNVLKSIKIEVEKVKKEIEAKMIKEEGFKWNINAGFHPIESMDHLHCHIISTDFISTALKNKKHYNSFSPSTNYFQSIDSIITRLETNQSPILQANSYYEQCLKQDLTSHYTGEKFKTIPALKLHLEQEFKKLAQSFKNKITTKNELEDDQPKKKKQKLIETIILSDSE